MREETQEQQEHLELLEDQVVQEAQDTQVITESQEDVVLMDLKEFQASMVKQVLLEFQDLQV